MRLRASESAVRLTVLDFGAPLIEAEVLKERASENEFEERARDYSLAVCVSIIFQTAARSLALHIETKILC